MSGMQGLAMDLLPDICGVAEDEAHNMYVLHRARSWLQMVAVSLNCCNILPVSEDEVEDRLTAYIMSLSRDQRQRMVNESGEDPLDRIMEIDVEFGERFVDIQCLADMTGVTYCVSDIVDGRIFDELIIQPSQGHSRWCTFRFLKLDDDWIVATI